MASVRWTTTNRQVPEIPERGRLAYRNAIKPVAGQGGIESDRRRTVREELDAERERIPVAVADDAMSDAREVANELSRLGSEAVHLLQPLTGKALRLANEERVDEQA